jgi:hypothetical protein
MLFLSSSQCVVISPVARRDSLAKLGNFQNCTQISCKRWFFVSKFCDCCSFSRETSLVEIMTFGSYQGGINNFTDCRSVSPAPSATL